MAKSRISTEIQGKVISSDELYAQARQWANRVRTIAKNNTAAFSKGKKKPYTYPTSTKWHKAGEREPKLSAAVAYKIKEKDGITDNIGFQFPRHGIFRAYGVGNGQSRTGKQAKKTFIKRTMSDWIDKPIDDSTDKLANIAAEFYGDQALINTFGK